MFAQSARLAVHTQKFLPCILKICRFALPRPRHIFRANTATASVLCGSRSCDILFFCFRILRLQSHAVCITGIFRGRVLHVGGLRVSLLRAVFLRRRGRKERLELVLINLFLFKKQLCGCLHLIGLRLQYICTARVAAVDYMLDFRIDFRRNVLAVILCMAEVPADKHLVAAA